MQKMLKAIGGPASRSWVGPFEGDIYKMPYTRYSTGPFNPKHIKPFSELEPVIYTRRILSFPEGKLEYCAIEGVSDYDAFNLILRNE